MIGLGKAGKSIALMAQRLGAHVFGVDKDEESVAWCQRHLSGQFAAMDAQNPLEITRWMQMNNSNKLADGIFHVTNIADTEMSGVLPCRDGGYSLFFGMNTSFQKVVLGAEGISKDIQLFMGSGFVPGHAQLMLELIRTEKVLGDWFMERFG